MRHDVTTWSFLFRKALDNLLYGFSGSVGRSALDPTLSQDMFSTKKPSGWLPLYTMVTFRPDIGYATAKRKAERQATVVTASGVAGLAAFVLSGALAWQRWARR